MYPESNADIAAVVESRTSLADKAFGLGSDVGVGTAVGDGVGEGTGVGRGVVGGGVGDGAGVVAGALVEVAVGDNGVSMAGMGVGLDAGESSPHADRETANRHSAAMIMRQRLIACDSTSKSATPFTPADTSTLTSAPHLRTAANLGISAALAPAYHPGLQFQLEAQTESS